MVVRSIIALCLLALSCAKPLPTNQPTTVSRMSEGNPCSYELNARYLHLEVFFDFCPLVFSDVNNNVQFWGDSAVVILNKIKHNESTLVCVPPIVLDISTKYSHTLDSVQHEEAPFLNLYAQINGHYSPTAEQRDTVVARCNKAIWEIRTLQQNVAWEVTGYNHYQPEVSWSTDGSF